MVMHDHAVHQMIRVPCTVRHRDPGGADDYGDRPLDSFTATTERCYPAQSTRREDDAIETERWTVYFLPSTAIDANDIIEVRGMVLDVWGAPWVVVDPVTGWDTHIETTAVRRR